VGKMVRIDQDVFQEGWACHAGHHQQSVSCGLNVLRSEIG
jgi:hypothetical protein